MIDDDINQSTPPHRTPTCGLPTGAGSATRDSLYEALVANMQWTYDAPARKNHNRGPRPLHAMPTAASAARQKPKPVHDDQW
jgi:hypothetical protein